MKKARLLITGSMNCTEKLCNAKKKDDQYNFGSSFNKINNILSDVDYSIAGVVSKEKDPVAPVQFFSALKDSGFSAVFYRDYHAADKEESAKSKNPLNSIMGLINKSRNKDEKNKASVVKHELVDAKPSYECSITEVNGIKIGLFVCAFERTVDDYSCLIGAEQAIKDMKDKGAEFVIGYVFWKIRYNYKLTEFQKVTARVLANMGIDYIVGTNTSYVLEYDVIDSEWGRSVPVAYSLGAFLGTYTKSLRMKSSGLILDISVDDNNVISCKDSYIPFYTFARLESHKYVVAPLNDKVYKAEHLNSLSEVHRNVCALTMGTSITLSHDYDVEKKPAEDKTEEINALRSTAWAEEILTSPDALQKKLLDDYRLTEEFRKQYGEAIYAITNNVDLIASARESIKDYRPDIELTEEDEKNLIIDLIYTRYIMGFKFYEYFSNDFDKVDIVDRTEYLPKEYRLNYYRRIQTNKAEIDHLDKKDTSYQRLKEFYRRDMILVQKRSDLEMFKEFTDKHKRFISKPVNGTYGRGIEIVNVDEIENITKYFYEMIAKGAYVCEELIISKDYLAAFHPESVNSVRVVTFNAGDEIRCAFAFLRTGRGGSVVDNASAGGVLAAVDLETGEVMSDGADEKGRLYVEHPDSGIKFKGFKIQDIDGMIETVSGAAKLYPEVKIIAWDVAHSDKGWQIIEGNSQGGINAWQFANKFGMRRQLEEMINFKKNIFS